MAESRVRTISRRSGDCLMTRFLLLAAGALALGGCSAADDDQVVMGHGNIPPSIGAKIARPTWRASRRVRRMPSRAVTEPSIRQASR